MAQELAFLRLASVPTYLLGSQVFCPRTLSIVRVTADMKHLARCFSNPQRANRWTSERRGLWLGEVTTSPEMGSS